AGGRRPAGSGTAGPPTSIRPGRLPDRDGSAGKGRCHRLGRRPMSDAIDPVLQPAIVLVEPQLGEDVGTAARAMANFGLTDLRLVNPREGWPNEKARAAASRADHVIDRVRVFPTIAEAIADLRFVFATTARAREVGKPVSGPHAATLRLRRMAGA